MTAKQHANTRIIDPEFLALLALYWLGVVMGGLAMYGILHA